MSIASVLFLIAVGVVLTAAEMDPKPAGSYVRTPGPTAIPPLMLSGPTSDAFTLTCRLDVAAFGTPGVLLAARDAAGKDVAHLELRQAGKDPSLKWWDEDPQQNYLRFGGPTGGPIVLEAIVDVAIAPPYRTGMKHQIRIGVPVPLLGTTPGQIVVRLKPGRVELAVDGHVVDEEWPCGGPARPLVALVPTDRVVEARVWQSYLDDTAAAITPTPGYETGTLPGQDLQYWSPPGHNQWVGDVMLSHDGERLHLLYLVDRRHGASKNCGGHQIAHLSTSDLQTWTAHPLAVPITEPWETLGTGSLVKQGARWHILYGLHTDRIVEASAVANGNGTAQAFADLKGLPIGTAIASSDDGIHFHKDNLLVHPAQNPSVFADPRGGFAMFAGYGADGLYHSPDLHTWTAADHFITPFAQWSPTRNSTECFSHLEWGEWNYLLGGRTGFWMARSFAGPYWDQTHGDGPAIVKGLNGYFGWRLKGAPPVNPRPAGTVTSPRWDIYDGLWVPMVASMPSGRRILAGWLEDLNRWAGCLVLRELHQEPDGNLSMSWLPESVPRTGPAQTLTWSGAAEPLTATTAPAVRSAEAPAQYLLEVEVDPGAAANGYAIVLGASGHFIDGCELRIEPQRKRAQWGTPAQGKPAPEIPDAATIFATPEGRKPVFEQHCPNLPYHGTSFAITGVEGLDRPHRVRIAVVRDRKSGSVIIDAEIAGRRTMITRRRDLVGNRLHLVALSGTVGFREVTVRPILR